MIAECRTVIYIGSLQILCISKVFSSIMMINQSIYGSCTVIQARLRSIRLWEDGEQIKNVGIYI